MVPAIARIAVVTAAASAETTSVQMGPDDSIQLARLTLCDLEVLVVAAAAVVQHVLVCQQGWVLPHVGYLASLAFPPPTRSLAGLTIFRDK